MSSRTLTLGILAGLVTGMLWGIVFVVPQLLPQFSALELSLGRYFFFAIASCTTLRETLRHWRGFDRGDKWQVFWLSASGFWLYTLLLFWAVALAGGVLTTLVIGLLPVTIPLFAKKTLKLDAGFALGLALIVIGLGVLEAKPLLAGSAGVPLLGWLPLLSCLVLWTWFGIANTRFVQKHPAAKVSLTNLMGLSSFIILAVICLFAVDLKALVAQPHFGAFVFWSAVVGFGSSWLANWFWNICSSLVPATISGPLVVAETSFGLLYTFIFQHRLPDGAELAAMLLFAFGVFLALHAEIGRRKAVLT
ncbi:MAG: DMT family transporter [Micavibrio sp.]|nr:DMT family transporter [Micavibrio sp.]